MSSDRLARWVGLPIAVLAVSTSGILIRTTTAAPLVTATNRLLGAAAVLLVIAALTRKPASDRPIKTYVPLLALSGVLLGIHFALWTSSLFWTSVASAVLLTDTHPALDALGSQFLLREASSPGIWLGVAGTLIGSAIITGGDVFARGDALVGDLMALGASVTFTGYLLIGRRVRRSLSTAAYAGSVYLIAGLTTAILALATGHGLTESADHDWPLIAALIAIPTLAGHTVFNWALRFVPAPVVGVAIVGEPVATTAWAWLLLGEPPSIAACIGGSLAIAGIVLALRSQTTHRPARTPTAAIRTPGS